MVMKESSKALGRGLKALIRDRDKGPYLQRGEGAPLDAEAKAQNMEFYGSLMKQYIQVGEGDKNTEEMLQRIRAHLGIDDEEHEHLLQTLRKRDIIDPKVSQEELLKAQKEMKQELKQLFMEFKDDIGPVIEDVDPTKVVEYTEEDEERAIQLPERSSTVMYGHDPIPAPPVTSNGDAGTPVMKKRIRRLVTPKDLDERAGIISDTDTAKRTRLDWLDEGNKASIPMPPYNNPEVPDRNDISSGLPEKQEGPDESKVEEFEDLGEVPESGPPVQAINVVKGSEVLKDMLDEGGIESVKPMVKGELRSEVEMAIAGPARPGSVEKGAGAPVEDSLISLKLLMDDGKLNEAYEMSGRLLIKEPANTSILNERGVVLFNMGRTDEALDLYKKILDTDQDSVETMINYALVLSEKGRLDESLEHLDRAVRKDPYSEDAWNNKAVVLSKTGRLRDALVCLDEAIRINDRSVLSWMNTGIILERMGECGPAMECYRNILDMEPDNTIAKQGFDTCRSRLG